MRIKPWVVTGAGAVCAAGALGVIVATNDPYTASTGVLFVFWTSLVLVFWGVGATVCLLARMHLSQAVAIGFTFAVGLVAALATFRVGQYADWLLVVIVLGTLAVSFLLWKRFKSHA